MPQPEIYLSVDVEADGPLPGLNSMLSFGIAAFLPPSREPVATFSANLTFLPDTVPDIGTMKWWETQPAAWEECRRDVRDPAEVMPELVKWAKKLPGKPVLIGFPAAYDAMFLNWYTIHFGLKAHSERGKPKAPWSHSALDIKTMAFLMTGAHSYKGAGKRSFPKQWFEGAPRHDHTALTDAIEQGILFVNMLNEFRKQWRPFKIGGEELKQALAKGGG